MTVFTIAGIATLVAVLIVGCGLKIITYRKLEDLDCLDLSINPIKKDIDPRP